MKISAKSFVTFLIASGRSKVSAVAKSREPYRPEQDFYKRLREALDKCSSVDDFDLLPTEMSLTQNATKQVHFRLLIDRLKGFLSEGNHQVLPFKRQAWDTKNFHVSIPATVRLAENNQPFVLMYWLKAAEPTKNEIEYFSAILELAYSSTYPKDRFGILDIRRMEIKSSSSDAWLEQYLAAESAAFQSIWDSLEDAA